MLKWVFKAKHIAELPTVGPILLEHRIADVLTEAEVIDLIQAAPPRRRVLFWFMTRLGAVRAKRSTLSGRISTAATAVLISARKRAGHQSPVQQCIVGAMGAERFASVR